jgi:hypothetical protein
MMKKIFFFIISIIPFLFVSCGNHIKEEVDKSIVIDAVTVDIQDTLKFSNDSIDSSSNKCQCVLTSKYNSLFNEALYFNKRTWKKDKVDF